MTVIHRWRLGTLTKPGEFTGVLGRQHGVGAIRQPGVSGREEKGYGREKASERAHNWGEVPLIGGRERESYKRTGETKARAGP
jgi:hypothetical protein